MGRYYYGSIEGQFWPSVQSSDTADRFGVYGNQPNYLEYDFTEDNLEEVEEELEKIKDFLGDKLEKLDEFYGNNHPYCSNKDISDYLGVPLSELSYILAQYADYGFGTKIRDAIKKNGHCRFFAEL